MRLVLLLVLQKLGRDLEETYTLVAKLSTMRTVLAVATAKHYYTNKMNFKTVFSKGNLQDYVCLKILDRVSSSCG